MRVCITSTEFLGVGASGGLGVAARTLGRHLIAYGTEVCAIIPHSGHHSHAATTLDEMSIRTYRRWDLKAFTHEVRTANADVYHHIQGSLGARLAQWAVPDRAHVVECSDPRDWSDWWIDFRLPTHGALRLIPSFLYFGTKSAAFSVQCADAVQVPAQFLQAKVRCLYGPGINPQYVPMPFDAPSGVEKSLSPLVVSVGRLVRRKRPEILLNLAQHFPDVRFVIIGEGSDAAYSREIRRSARLLANVTFTDFVNQATDARLFDYLSRAWILINTAAREGLPLTFIEAAAHRCAILSTCDPDGYASNFGYHVTDGDFVRGLGWLVSEENWRMAGARAHAHVMREHSSGPAMKRQLSLYEEAIARAKSRRSIPSSNSAAAVG